MGDSVDYMYSRGKYSYQHKYELATDQIEKESPEVPEFLTKRLLSSLTVELNHIRTGTDEDKWEVVCAERD